MMFLRRLLRLIRSEVIVIAGGQVVQQGLGLLTGVIIGRVIGAAGFGLVNILRNILAPLQILAPLGLDIALLKYVGRGDRTLESTHRLVRRLRLVVLAVNLPVTLVTGFFLGRILMQRVYPYPHFDLLLLVTLLALPFVADTAVLGAYYRARSRPAPFALMTLYLQPVVRLALVGVAFLFARNAAAIICVGTAQAAFNGLTVWLHFGRWRGRDMAVGEAAASGPAALLGRTSGDEWRLARVVLGDSVWMALSLFVYGMMRFVDVLMLGAFAPAAVVGAYTALGTVAQLISVWPQAASQTLGPRISHYHHQGDREGVRRALNDYIQFSSLISGFLFAGVAAFGDHLDLLFGPSFHFRPTIAFLISLGFLISATLGPTGYALSMTGRHRAELVILIAGAVTLWALCLVLIPLRGDVGAATAVCLSFTLVNLMRFLWVGWTLGFIPGRAADLAPPVLAALVAFGVKFALVAQLPRTLPALAFGCVTYALAYGALAYRFLLTDAGRARLRALDEARGVA